MRAATGILVCAIALLPAVACGPAPENPSASVGSEWQGTTTTEGDVTTVVNESGSVWGEPVEVVETLSIGERTGEEPYLLGNVSGLGATEDRIYVLDSQLSEVRVYDRDGRHLFDFGGPGEGPGDLYNSRALGLDPEDRILVRESSRVSVFSLDGEFLETWPYPGIGWTMTIRHNGGVYLPSSWLQEGGRVSGLVVLGRDGSEERRVESDAPDESRWQAVARTESGAELMRMRIAHAPADHLDPLPSGALVRGHSATYRFEIEHPDGRRTVIERPDARVPVSTAEREWRTENITARVRDLQPDWSWDVNPIPRYRPAFDRFLGDRFGRVWVQRVTGVERRTDCDEDARPTDANPRPIPCWDGIEGFDVFDEESGRFLGQVELPRGFEPSASPAFLEDGLLVAVQDAAGTIRVKRFRLRPPGEERP